jgi:hypothetical protein
VDGGVGSTMMFNGTNVEVAPNLSFAEYVSDVEPVKFPGL